MFTIAVPKPLNNKETDFFSCIAWRNNAEYFCKYVKKGAKIAISGSLETRSYQSKDGTTKYVTEIVCDSIEQLQSSDYVRENTDTSGYSDEETSEQDIDDIF